VPNDRSAGPQEFHFAFPTALLAKLVQDVSAYCGAAGIKCYKPDTMPIARLLNESWARFLSDPGGYRTWEVEQVSELTLQLTCQ
jgi:hypothetical protein